LYEENKSLFEYETETSLILKKDNWLKQKVSLQCVFACQLVSYIGDYDACFER